MLFRSTGNPISICAVYMLLAKRLRLPITGIGMPGHFICRHQSAVREFYIDVFNKGRLLTRNDCVKFLVSTGHENFEVFLSPMSPRRVLLRMALGGASNKDKHRHQTLPSCAERHQKQ